MFGRWSVVYSDVLRDDKYRYIAVKCVGCESYTIKSYDNVVSGKSKGCLGCRVKDRTLVDRKYKWIIKRYEAMQSRCNNPHNPSYPAYGGRGIQLKFYRAKDLVDYVIALPGFDKQKELDRIDNNGNYEPGNLRWADRHTQTRNIRRNIHVTYQDQDYIFKDFVDLYTDLSFSRARILLSRGYTPEEIATYKPSNKGRRAQNLRLAKLREQP